jgi:hypothetical protein
LGIDKKTQSGKNFVEVTNNTKTRRKERLMVSDCSKNITTIDASMLEYLKLIFKEEAFGDVNRDRAIVDYIVTFASEIKSIADAQRNPAAHSNVMSYYKAEMCANTLIKEKKLLCKFIEKIDFEKIKVPQNSENN